ncbi:MAG: esterase/lipase family protein [Candidatus Binataceae bacterium]
MLGRKVVIFLQLIATIPLLLACSLARAQPPAVGRPILYVPGVCDVAASAVSLQASVINYVTRLQPSLYTNPAPWTVYYDGKSVKTWPNGEDFTSTVPSSARFFAIDFFDPSSANFASINRGNVARVSIFNKADELAHVIQAITSLTHVKDVVVVAHSQGGLAARAYIENLAVHAGPSGGTCSDRDAYACLSMPKTYYAQDIGKLITLDTPHGGAVLANLISATWLDAPPLACILQNTLNRRELEVSSFVIRTLNSNALNPPPSLTIASIRSYTSPGFSLAVGPDGDGVLTLQEQSLQGVVPSMPNYYDVTPSSYFGPFITFYGSAISGYPSRPYPLHLAVLNAPFLTANAIKVELNKILAHGPPARTTSITVQAPSGVSYTLAGPVSRSGAGPNTYYDLPTGTYTLSYPGGSAQQTLGVDHSTGSNNWNPVLIIPGGGGVP